ncbi:hypothetical protein RM844_11075 [Streptomyces sp. DSM 44915]|uniref:Uncharacterized protein n=1 Tax=Streptomyces chisholmiae TaxID=3075540 RepID=A0ABU2JQ26_9ACTN|nr:hypothetical protein [Streptomyces sp. DSM 44915]MDT0266833.1 hypothetical protein [Streptomyces sp. DSM 44915]
MSNYQQPPARQPGGPLPAHPGHGYPAQAGPGPNGPPGYGYPPGPGQRPGPAAHPGPPPPARRRRSGALLGLVLALVLIAGAVTAGVLLLGDDGDSGSDLAVHPELSELPFPDAGALRHEDGQEGMCLAVEELLAARGYALFGGSSAGDTIQCVLGAPGTSQLADGSHNLQAVVALTRGDGAAYDTYLATAERARENLADDTTFTFSELAGFPAGEEGFIDQNVWTGGPSGSATAAFRSGDDTFYLHISGSLVYLHSDTDSEPLTVETTRGELVDVVKTLAGDGATGEPLITPAELAEYPGLPELTEPLLPDGSGAESCAAVASVAERYSLGVEAESPNGGTLPSTQCAYAIGTEHPRFAEAGLPHYRIEVTQYDYGGAPEGLLPTEDLGRDLRGVIANEVDPFTESTEVTLGPLYALPVGESGYLVHTTEDSAYGNGIGTHLDAGYVIGERYVRIRLGGADWDSGDAMGFSEERLVELLGEVLTAMEG